MTRPKLTANVTYDTPSHRLNRNDKDGVRQSILLGTDKISSLASLIKILPKPGQSLSFILYLYIFNCETALSGRLV